MKLFGSIKEVVTVVFRLAGGKEVRLTPGAQTGGSISPEVPVEIEIPDVGASGSDTLVTAGAVQTLTNKTIDANGTGNSITNLEEEDFQTKLADANKVLTRDASGVVTSATITNSNVNATAAIAESKLSLNYSTSTLNSAIATKIPKFTIADENAIVVTDAIIDGTVKQAPVTVNPTTGSIDTLGAGPWSLGASVGANNLTVGGATTTVVIPGNLQIDGTSTTVNTSTLDVEDTNITVNKGGSDATSEVSGLTVDRVGTDGSLISKNTSATQWAAGSLGSEVDLVGISSSQTLTNKTLTSPVLNDYMDINEEASPATPSAGAVRFYAKSDKKLYTKDSNGVEQEIGSGSGQGEKNYIENPSASSSTTGWVATDPSLAITRITTPSVLPREYTTGTGLQIVVVNQEDAIANNARITYNFTLDDVDLNKKLKIEWAQKAFGGGFQVYIAAAANTLIPLSPVFTIPSSDTVFGTSFDSTSTAALALVITATGDTGNTLTISDVIVGPGQIQAVPAIGTWQSFTPSWSNITVGNGTSTGRYQRVGDSMILEANLLFGTTTSVSGSIALFLPTGHSASLQAGNFFQAGVVSAYDASNVAARQTGSALVSGSTLSVLFSYSGSGGGTWNATTPFTWATNDAISVKAIIPIAEWAGAPNYAGSNDVEYAFNTSVTDAADTTSFGYGPSGTPLPSSAFTSRRDKRVRFLTPIQATDIILVQVDTAGTGRWLNIGDIAGAGVGSRNITSMIFQNSTYYGFGAFNTINSTDIDVSFGRYAYPSGATYASAGANWSATTGVGRWRVVKAKAGAAVGFGAATNTSAGLVKMDSGATTNNVGEYQEGSFTATYNGYASPPTVTATYVRVGKHVTLYIPNATGTSNSTSFSISGAPAEIRPATVQRIGLSTVTDNGTQTIAWVTMSTIGTLTYTKAVSLTSWGASSFTASGTKGHSTDNVVYFYSLY